MKKLLLFIIVVSVCIFGQAKKDINNSTTTSTVPLDSSEVWTGYRVDVSEYNSVSVSMWSDDTATVQLQFGNLVNTVFTVQRYWTFTYIESDTNWTKSVPVVAPYFRAIVTNTAYDSMTVFRVTTLLHKGVNLPTDDNAYVLTNVAVSEPLDSMEVNIEEGNTLLQDIDNNTDGVEASLDSIEVNTEEENVLLEDVKTKLDSIEVNIEEGNVLLQDIDNNTDLVETKLDSVEVNVEESNSLLQSIINNTDAIEPSLDSIEVNIEESNTISTDIRTSVQTLDNIVAGSEAQVDIVASLPAGTNAIGNLTDGSESMMIDNGATYDGILVRLTDGTNLSSLSGTGDLEVSGDGGVALATKAGLDSIEVNLEENNAMVSDIRTSVQTLDNIVSGSEAQVDIITNVHPIGMSSDSTFAVSVSGAASQLPSLTCKKLIITNFTTGEVLYYGSSASVTTSNGFPLFYGDVAILEPTNANQYYLISDGTTIDARISTEN